MTTALNNRRSSRSGFLVSVVPLLVVCALAAGCGSTSSPTAPTPAPTGTATVSSLFVSSVSTSGASFQMTAVARMSDGTSSDVTNTSAWESSNTAVATVSNTGLVRVISAGEFDVRASYQGVLGTSHLRFFVLPIVEVIVFGPTVPDAGAFQLGAVAKLSDGSLENVTDNAGWVSSNPSVASVAPGGFVTVNSAGNVDFTASYQGIVGTVRLGVKPAPTYTLTGFVVDGSGAPLPNVRVQILGVAHGFTNASGAYSVAGVRPGNFTVEYMKAGYQTWGAQISFSANEEHNATLYVLR